MSRPDVRALAALVVLLACSQGGRDTGAEPFARAPGAERAALAIAPAQDITASLYQPSNPGWIWAPNLAGGGGLNLVTWVVFDGLQTDVMGARVTADGALLDADGIAIASAPGDQKATAVAGGDGGWVVAWVDLRSGLFPTGPTAAQGEVYAARVDLDGNVLDPGGIPVATGPVLRTDVGVAFAGANWLVTWKEGNAFAGALLDLGGAAGAPFPVGASSGSVGFSDLSCGGTTCLQAWMRWDVATGERDLEGVRIDAALGTAIDPAPFAISASPGRQDAPKLSFDGRDWLVVFEDSRAGNGYEVWAARVSQAGGVLDPEGIRVSTAPSTVPGRPAVTFDGRNHVVEWRDSRDGSTELDLWTRTVAPDGALLGGETLVFDGVPGARLARIGSAGGGRSLLVFTENLVGSIPLHGRVITDDDARPALGLQAMLGPVSQVDSPTGTGYWQRPEFATGAGGHLVVWQERNALTPPVTTDLRAARISEDGTVLDPGGFLVSSATGNQSFPSAVWAGTHWVVVWVDYRTNPPDLYGARVATDGSVLDPDGVLVAGGDGASQLVPELALDGTRIVAVWAEWSPGAPIQIRATVLDPATLLPLASAFAVGEIPPGVRYGFPRVGCGGGTCLVTWNHAGGGDLDLYGARVDPAGALIDPAPFPICDLPGDQGSGSISWDGLGWIVDWEDGRSLSGQDVYATRVGPDGIVQDADGFPVAEPRNADTNPTPSTFDGSRHLICWTDEARGGQGFLRAMDPDGTLYQPDIQLTEAPAPVRSARVGVTRPGRAVVHFTYPDPTTTGVSHVFARSLTLRPPAFRLTVVRGGTGSGTVTSSPAGIDCGTACAAEFPAGSSVTLTARAASGSVFSGWSGACAGTSATCTVGMDDARTVGAAFSPVTYPLTVRTSGTGRGTVTGSGISCTSGSTAGCSATFAAATPVTLTATAEAGSVFTSWSGCTSVSGNVCTVSMTAARTVTATFQPATWLLTARTSGTGRGTVTGAGITCTTGSTAGCTASVPNTSPATSVALTATAEAGSLFTSWSGCTSVSGNVCTVSMTAARTVTATFADHTYPLTVTLFGTGTGTVTGPGISCSTGSTSGCSARIPMTEPATMVTLVASDAVETFGGWAGCTTVEGSTCVVEMSSAKTVSATFVGMPAACSLPTAGLYATFRIPATPERPEQIFWASLTGAEGMQSALDAWQGRTAANIPAGPLVCQPAPWNCGWPWHQDPATVRVAQVTVEVCDGIPPRSQEECLVFAAGSGGSYCPWSAQLVELRDCRVDRSCPVVPR